MTRHIWVIEYKKGGQWVPSVYEGPCADEVSACTNKEQIDMFFWIGNFIKEGGPSNMRVVRYFREPNPQRIIPNGPWARGVGNGYTLDYFKSDEGAAR
jgi:hypothetical protein